MELISMEKTPFFQNKNRFIQIIIMLLIILGSTIIFTSLGQVIVLLISGKEFIELLNSINNLRIIQFCSTIGTFLVPALIFSYLSNNNLFSYSASDKLPKWQPVIVIAVLSIFLLPVVYSLAYLNEMMQLPDSLSGIESWMKEMEEKSNSILKLMTDDSRISVLLLNILLISLLPALCEEFFFRGTIQAFFQRWSKNSHLAVWITAFIFSAIHLQFYGFIPRLLLGAYMGYLFVWSGSLWLPIAAHFLHNSFSLIFNYIDINSEINFENMTPSDIPGYIPIIITSILVVSAGLFLIRRYSKTKDATSITETASKQEQR